MDALPTTVILSQDALFQDLDGEGVILDLRSSSYFGVDGAGVRLWLLLQNNPDLTTAVNQLLEEFDVAREQLESDVAKFVAKLSEVGLASVA